MTADMRLRQDEEHALRWLQRRLEWEEILAALRDAGGGSHVRRAPRKQEPAAA